jgi:pimeloyl-ACP methyl ester carboxylesterase
MMHPMQRSLEHSRGLVTGRLLVAVLLLLAIMLAGYVWAARQGHFIPSEADLLARYALPESKFTTIGGQQMHYVDEGTGPVVVLMHGSFASLRQWDEWAAALRSGFRVVRYDRPPMGLSGTTAVSGIDVEREIAELNALLAELGVERFFLVATSSAGLTGAAYAAQNPERVQGLILANIATGPFTPDPSHRSATLNALIKLGPWFKGWRPTLFWSEILEANYFDPEKIPPGLAREWTDLNNRAIRMPRNPAAPAAAPPKESPFARTPSDLQAIRVPTLLLWSENDHEFPPSKTAQDGLRLLGSTDKALDIVPQCGHLMPLECGAESAARAAAFFTRLTSPANETLP